MLDATRGIESQDQNIFSLIQRNNRGVIILVNKCDLIENMNDESKSIKTQILNKISPFDDVPIMFISVLLYRQTIIRRPSVWFVGSVTGVLQNHYYIYIYIII